MSASFARYSKSNSESVVDWSTFLASGFVFVRSVVTPVDQPLKRDAKACTPNVDTAFHTQVDRSSLASSHCCALVDGINFRSNLPVVVVDTGGVVIPVRSNPCLPLIRNIDPLTQRLIGQVLQGEQA
eukprot:370841-Pelagomonas_calceolata.AAC.2